ncbi:MAG: acylphosphatase, partial [Pyrinomonadaceae bacterium]
MTARAVVIPASRFTIHDLRFTIYNSGRMAKVARKFLIRGDVQGVGYRFFAQRAAAKHQVLGYV